jgi:hypothetical protein
MADVGELNYVPCSCPAPAGTPHIGTGAPTASDVGQLDCPNCCPYIVFDSPAPGDMGSEAALVFEGHAPEGVGNIQATVTVGGVPTVVFNTSDGFEPGYTGSTAAAGSDGVQVTVSSVFGWPLGELTLTVEVIDDNGATVTADDSWAVVAPDDSDLVAEAQSLVIIQYRYAPKLNAVVAMHAWMAQQVVDCANSVPPLDDTTQATGVNQDVNGEIVGQLRLLGDGTEMTDSEYAVVIGARITRNHAHVDPASYLSYLATFFGAPVTLIDHGGMSITYQVGREPTADELAMLNDDIVARPMGVQVTRQWYDPDYFALEEVSDPGGHGLADDSGGYPGVGGGDLITDF